MIAFEAFAWMHKTLRLSPAMIVDSTDRLWSMEDSVALIDARESEPKKRGPYKKQSSMPQRKTNNALSAEVELS
jgi:hypothetical protein